MIDVGNVFFNFLLLDSKHLMDYTVKIGNTQFQSHFIWSIIVNIMLTCVLWAFNDSISFSKTFKSSTAFMISLLLLYCAKNLQMGGCLEAQCSSKHGKLVHVFRMWNFRQVSPNLQWPKRWNLHKFVSDILRFSWFFSSEISSNI